MKLLYPAAAVVLVVSSIGCMPTVFPDAVAWQIRQQRATDAKSQPVEGMSFLRVDDYLLDRLGAAEKLPDDEARGRILELLGRCHALAVDTAEVEIGRLSKPALSEVWRTCFPGEPAPVDVRDAIRRQYVQFLEDEYQSYSRNLTQDSSGDHLREQVALIRDRVRPAMTDQRGQGVFLEMARASLPDEPKPPPSRTAKAIAYEPGPVASEPVKSAFDDAALRALLVQFAPRILQENSHRPSDAANCDMIGSVRLGGSPGRIEVAIQTDEPSVYAYARTVVVRDRDYVQLVYCYWFPEHPPAKFGDPEAGPIDGATLRITLDSESRPAIIEAVQNCGCHFRCFAARPLDDAARRDFGPPADPATSALTRPEGGVIEIIADDVFDLPAGAATRPIVFSPAGSHVPVGISFSDAALSAERIQARKRYELHAYELLENMPTDFGRASMFGADGLVHNAGRLEGWLMAGTGMLSAGQPRQRGTQLICWDKRSFDDPHLLEETLRLPKDF